MVVYTFFTVAHTDNVFTDTGFGWEIRIHTLLGI